MNEQVQRATEVYQRDNSWWCSRGRGGRYHFLGNDLASRCGRARMLDTDNGVESSDVPQILRCQARGCKEHWQLG